MLTEALVRRKEATFTEYLIRQNCFAPQIAAKICLDFKTSGPRNELCCMVESGIRVSGDRRLGNTKHYFKHTHRYANPEQRRRRGGYGKDDRQILEVSFLYEDLCPSVGSGANREFQKGGGREYLILCQFIWTLVRIEIPSIYFF